MVEIIIIILPLIAVGSGMVLLINNLKKKYKARNQYEQSISEDYMALGMSLGMCFGVAISSIFSIFTNTFGANSISYGICFGMLGGMLIGMNIKKKWWFIKQNNILSKLINCNLKVGAYKYVLPFLLFEIVYKSTLY